jgi:hypothetical protein
MTTHDTHIEPKLTSHNPPLCFLLVLDEAENSKEFYAKCLEKKLNIRSLSDNTLLFYSFDTPECTKHFLKEIGQPKYPVGILKLGVYDEIK